MNNLFSPNYGIVFLKFNFQFLSSFCQYFSNATSIYFLPVRSHSSCSVFAWNGGICSAIELQYHRFQYSASNPRVCVETDIDIELPTVSRSPKDDPRKRKPIIYFAVRIFIQPLCALRSDAVELTHLGTIRP